MASNPFQLDLPFLAELTALRRDIHAHPELAFDEYRTSDIVAAELSRYGLEVHRGLARTGVVGVLKAGTSSRMIGLRADMDALPLAELNEFPHHSKHPGKMHASVMMAIPQCCWARPVIWRQIRISMAPWCSSSSRLRSPKAVLR